MMMHRFVSKMNPRNQGLRRSCYFAAPSRSASIDCSKAEPGVLDLLVMDFRAIFDDLQVLAADSELAHRCQDRVTRDHGVAVRDSNAFLGIEHHALCRQNI